MDDEWPPSPPEGYRHYDPDEEMGWSQSDYQIIIGVFWICSLIILIGISSVSARIGRLFNVFVLAAVAIVIHEGLHGLAGKLFRLKISAGINLKRFRPYVLTHGGFQSRLQTAFIVAAPLVGFSLFCLVAIFVLTLLNHPTADIAILAIMNIVLAYHDILDLWFILNLPEGAKEYHRKGRDIAYYAPVSNDSSKTTE